MQVPQSPTVYGPQRADGPWETCFAHSPSGALLAAMNFYAEGTAAAPSAVLAHLAVNVTAADMTGGGLDANGPVQLAGYRYVAYTPVPGAGDDRVAGTAGQARRGDDRDALDRR